MRIPLYDSEKTPQAGSGSVHSLGGERRSPIKTPQTKEGVFRELNNAANTMVDIGNKMVEAERVEQYNEALVKLTEGFSNIKTEFETNKDYFQLNTEEHLKRQEEMSSTLRNAILDGVKDRKAIKAIELEYAKMDIRNKSQIQSLGWNRQVDRGRAKTMEGLDIVLNNAIKNQDMEAYGTAEAMINSAVAAGYYNQQEAVKLIESFNNSAVVGTFTKMAELDPKGTYDDTVGRDTEPESWKYLDETQKANLISKIKTEHNQWRTNQVNQIQGHWKNRLVDDVEKTYEAFKKLEWEDLKPMNEEEFAVLKATIYGAWESKVKSEASGTLSPVITGRIKRRMEEGVNRTLIDGEVDNTVIADIQAWTSGTEKTREKGQAYVEEYNAEVNKALAKFTAGKVVDATPPSQATDREQQIVQIGETASYTSAKEMLDVYKVGMDRKVRDLNTNPVGWVVSKIGVQEPTYESIDWANSNDQQREQFRRNCALVVKHQVHQEVPEHMLRIFTNDYAKQLKNRIETADRNEAYNILSNLRDVYGPFYKYAIRDLAREGMNPNLEIITSLDPLRDKATLDYLADAYTIDENLVKKELSDFGTTKNTIWTEINRQMNDYQNSVMAQDPMGGRNAEKTSRIKAEVYKVGLMVAKNGGSNSDIKRAVREVIDTVFNNRYNYESVNGMTYRIPIARNNVPLETKPIRQALDDYLEDFDVTWKDKIVVPGIVNVAETRLDYVTNTYIDSVMDNGYWATSEDESGVYLMNADGKPVMVKTHGKAQKIYLSFQDLVVKGKEIKEKSWTTAAKQGAVRPFMVASDWWEKRAAEAYKFMRENPIEEKIQEAIE